MNRCPSGKKLFGGAGLWIGGDVVQRSDQRRLIPGSRKYSRHRRGVSLIWIKEVGRKVCCTGVSGRGPRTLVAGVRNGMGYNWTFLVHGLNPACNWTVVGDGPHEA